MKTLNIVLTDSKIIEVLKREIKKVLKGYYDQILRGDIQNSIESDVLTEALLNGQVYFKDGKFYGKFNSKLTKKFKSIGGVFKSGSWEVKNIDAKYLSAIAQGKIIDQGKIQKILDNLGTVQLKKLEFKTILDKAVTNLNKELDISFAKLPTVRAQFDDNQLKNIAEKYTHTLERHIVGWSDDETIKLREVINETVRQGLRYEYVAKEIQAKYNLTENKALFIARQETRLLASEMKQQKCEKVGFHRYIWKTRQDSKVRDDHAHLQDEVFRFDDPPEIDSRTGKHGNPGETYNCRCTALPIIE